MKTTWLLLTALCCAVPSFAADGSGAAEAPKSAPAGDAGSAQAPKGSGTAGGGGMELTLASGDKVTAGKNDADQKHPYYVHYSEGKDFEGVAVKEHWAAECAASASCAAKGGGAADAKLLRKAAKDIAVMIMAKKAAEAVKGAGGAAADAGKDKNLAAARDAVKRALESAKKRCAKVNAAYGYEVFDMKAIGAAAEGAADAGAAR